MEVAYRASFVRQLAKLEPALQAEVYERVSEFQKIGNHQRLRVHPLHGKLRGLYSFSVNYRYRIIFEWALKNTVAVLLHIGDHDLYR